MRIRTLNFFYARLVSIVILVFLAASCSTRYKPAPVVAVYRTVPLKERVKKSIDSIYYTVKKGETLYSIAWRANSDVRQLAKINNIGAPYKIIPGQRLKIVEKMSLTSAKTTSNKSQVKKPSKSSTIKKKNIVKKPVAPSKKQEYGEATSGQKLSKKASWTGSTFSKKISKWQWPAKGKVIANFSTAQNGNKGIDIAGRRGDSIKAAAAGKVVYAGRALRGYGKLIIVKHNDDYLSAYAHNDKILVEEQQFVKAGDVIAAMGDTDAKNVMLHFEVRFRGKSVNPMKYLPK